MSRNFLICKVLVNPGNKVNLEWTFGKTLLYMSLTTLEGGYDASGEVYYIGQHGYQNDILCGKIQHSKVRLYVSYIKARRFP